MWLVFSDAMPRIKQNIGENGEQTTIQKPASELNQSYRE